MISEAVAYSCPKVTVRVTPASRPAPAHTRARPGTYHTLAASAPRVSSASTWGAVLECTAQPVTSTTLKKIPTARIMREVLPSHSMIARSPYGGHRLSAPSSGCVTARVGEHGGGRSGGGVSMGQSEATRPAAAICPDIWLRGDAGLEPAPWLSNDRATPHE